MTGYESKKAMAQDKLESMEREALKLALETFESMNHDDSIFKGEFDGEIAVIKEALAQPAQEPVAFAGIEIWVGNARIAKYLTQTELHYARDPWMLMQYSAEMCISKLKDKNNG